MSDSDSRNTSPTIELTKENIADQLRGIERYNPEHKDLLTDYLDLQCKNNQYDLEANLTLLKLYQFSPHEFKAAVVERILLKALTNLPHPDFILCELLIDSSKPDLGNIEAITTMHRRLELSQFKDFWAELANQKELYSEIAGFEESVRKYICHVVGIAYQKIRVGLLKDILGVNSNQQEYDNLLKKNNWKPDDDGFVKIENQEDIIKTINITEKIELEQVTNILATYR